MNTLEITYNKVEFEKKFARMTLLMEKALSVMELIAQAKIREENHLDTAKTLSLFEHLRQRYIHKADISRRAVIRLSNYLDNLIPYIHL